MPYETESLTLRHYKTSDDDALLEFWNDASIQSTASYDYNVPMTMASVKDRNDFLGNKSLMWLIIIETSTSDFVGGAHLQWRGGPKNRDAILGISILPAKQSKGYGTEVVKFLIHYGFNNLALHRLSLEVFEGNPAAINLYKKCGFVEEGCRRNCLWRNGEWEDVFSMGILESEWRETLKSSD